MTMAITKNKTSGRVQPQSQLSAPTTSTVPPSNVYTEVRDDAVLSITEAGYRE